MSRSAAEIGELAFGDDLLEPGMRDVAVEQHVRGNDRLGVGHVAGKHVPTVEVAIEDGQDFVEPVVDVSLAEAM